MGLDHDFNKYPELTNAQLDVLELSSPHPQIKTDFWARVVKVHDGDTITLETDFRNFRFPLRLLNIDAPEMNAGGEITRDWLINRILGSFVEIKIDPYNRVGKYGRLLGRVYRAGIDVGEEEIQLGLAKPFAQRDEGKIPDINKIMRLGQWF